MQQTIALTLSLIGTALIIVNAYRVASLLLNFLNEIANDYGTWNMEYLPEELKRRIKKFKKISLPLYIVGIILLISGFILNILVDQG